MMTAVIVVDVWPSSARASQCATLSPHQTYPRPSIIPNKVRHSVAMEIRADWAGIINYDCVSKARNGNNNNNNEKQAKIKYVESEERERRKKKSKSMEQC